MALSPSQIQRILEYDDDMPVDEAPPDEGEGAPRQSYNFAPGYNGVVYRADVPDWGAGPRRGHESADAAEGTTVEVLEQTGAADEHTVEPAEPEPSRSGDATKQPDTLAPADELDGSADNDREETVTIKLTRHAGRRRPRYKLQTMRWGLVPFWTKRNPDYASVLRTINCRDDSLAAPGGMWAAIKGRKRCVVLAEGFYEWLQKGPKEKVPHYVKRADGKLMCFAGLWDCVQYEDSEQKTYTYTVITTDSNQQLKFLHDRMPVILEPGSPGMRAWLDPATHEWSRDLQALLRPWDGKLDVYPVSKDVGKVGNNSASFVVPVASRENKANIANFFANAAAKKSGDKTKKPAQAQTQAQSQATSASSSSPQKENEQADKLDTDVDGATSPSADELKPARVAEKVSAAETKSNAAQPAAVASPSGAKLGPKRSAETTLSPGRAKKAATAASPRKKISATSNGTKSPAKTKQDGSQKITKFFTNSA